MTLTDYMIECSSNTNIKVTDFSEVLVELKRIGNNLNQIARKANSRNVIGGVSSLAGVVSHIVDNDFEDPDERRKRIEADENGSALGTIIGLGIGVAAYILSDNPEKPSTDLPDFYYEEHKTREEILDEIFGADDYDYDDYDDSADEDEGTGFSMTM